MISPVLAIGVVMSEAKYLCPARQVLSLPGQSSSPYAPLAKGCAKLKKTIVHFSNKSKAGRYLVSGD